MFGSNEFKTKQNKTKQNNQSVVHLCNKNGDVPHLPRGPTVMRAPEALL